jgi:hypothetical protein
MSLTHDCVMRKNCATRNFLSRVRVAGQCPSCRAQFRTAGEQPAALSPSFAPGPASPARPARPGGRRANRNRAPPVVQGPPAGRRVPQRTQGRGPLPAPLQPAHRPARSRDDRGCARRCSAGRSTLPPRSTTGSRPGPRSASASLSRCVVQLVRTRQFLPWAKAAVTSAVICRARSSSALRSDGAEAHVDDTVIGIVPLPATWRCLGCPVARAGR